MTGVLILMLIVALLLGGAALTAFVVFARQGEFDDLQTPAVRAILDDDER